MSARLASKVALITGSSTGIGEAIARRFAAEGAAVLVHGLDEGEAAAVAEKIRGDGGTAASCAGDLARPETADRLVAATIEQLGGLDILVNNAAVKTRGDLEATDPTSFDLTMAVNVRAPLLLIRAALPHFRAQRGGVVLNIGSVNAYCGERQQVAYAISKAGLVTLSRNLADAHGPEGIRVNHFNLGWVLTPGEYELKRREGLPEGWPETLPVTFAPSGSLLAPDDIAHFALAFVEDGAHRVSGAVVDLDQYPIVGRNPTKEVKGA